MAIRELSQEEFNKIRPRIIETSYGLNNHSIFRTYDDAVNCTKPISLNGSPYKGRKNKGKTHIKDIVKLPDGRFALLSRQLCIDAGIPYVPGNVVANESEMFEKIESGVDNKNLESQVSATTETLNEEKLEKRDVKVCPKCGNEISVSSKFCDECGTNIEKYSSSVNLNLNDNVIQRSQIGAASVGNVNIQPNIIIPEKNNNSYLWFGLILIFIILILIFLIK
ncbi:MAG: zinc ribbon domain-containing protein [Candidatus Omnitrophica bacterium]|nr:zinc ribbon domain-containing protein [Candidatus Omnitrophota bacterium]